MTAIPEGKTTLGEGNDFDIFFFFGKKKKKNTGRNRTQSKAVLRKIPFLGQGCTSRDEILRIIPKVGSY